MKYAVIGGSVLTQIDGLEADNILHEEIIRTPYGQTSSAFTVYQYAGNELVYFNRHGKTHTIAPHQVNYRANMYALKQLGVTHVIASAAVGGIHTEMPPLQCVIPDQIIDYSYAREHTYNEKNNQEVKHIDFSYPFTESLRQRLISAAFSQHINCRTWATYGVTQGPRLETVAEIRRMQNDGCDIVGMTAMPEAALARELEMAYASCAIVVNWAAGKMPSVENTTENIVRDVISVQQIKTCIEKGNKQLQKIVSFVVSGEFC